MHHNFSNLKILWWPLELNTSKIKKIYNSYFNARESASFHRTASGIDQKADKEILLGESNRICCIISNLSSIMASYFEAVAHTNTMAPAAPTRATIAGRFEAISSSMIASIMVWFVSKGQEISEGIFVVSSNQRVSLPQILTKIAIYFLISALRVYNGSNQKNKGTIHTSYGLFLHNKVPSFFWFDPF